MLAMMERNVYPKFVFVIGKLAEAENVIWYIDNYESRANILIVRFSIEWLHPPWRVILKTQRCWMVCEVLLCGLKLMPEADVWLLEIEIPINFLFT